MVFIYGSILQTVFLHNVSVFLQCTIFFFTEQISIYYYLLRNIFSVVIIYTFGYCCFCWLCHYLLVVAIYSLSLYYTTAFFSFFSFFSMVRFFTLASVLRLYIWGDSVILTVTVTSFFFLL